MTTHVATRWIAGSTVVLARRLAVALAVVGSSACAITPRYAPPEVSVPAAFKEAGDWKPAEPSDGMSRGAWWEDFGDRELNRLEEQVSVSNQTLKAAEAQFAQARALVGVARSAYVPQVGLALPVASVNQSETRPNPAKDTRFTDYLVRADVMYEADVWGRVRSTVDASRATAQAAAGDLVSVNLSLHAELATNYFQIRALDAEAELLDSTVAAYRHALKLTTNRHNGGLASGLDVAQAEAQLEATRALATDVRSTRARLEHAVAVLVGQPASTFSLATSVSPSPVPAVPGVVPSSLLERRPDIAAAERRVAAANAQLGITKSAYYPLLALGASAGFESASLGSWLKAASGFWTVVPAAALTVFDGGRRRATAAQASAAYERTVATYRETTLGAFKEVEDHLAAIRFLDQQAVFQEAAVSASRRALTQATHRYTGGISTYLEVVVAQTALLVNQRAAVNIAVRRRIATVLLIKAIGGGWHQRALPRV